MRDERAVSARLESLEVGMKKLMDAVQQQGAAGRVNSFQAAPKVVVTAPAGGAWTGLVPFHDSSVGRVMNPVDTGYQNFTSE